ncbi:MAG: O-antigen ligase family protein [Ruminococcaceae bacterium]|nr:O-antigen ligase family protein [Oscillospiraceae bacterium]
MKGHFVERLQRFYGSRAYLFAVAALVLLGHTTVFVGDRMLFGGYQEFLFGGLMLLSLALGCFVCNDARFMVMPFITFIFLITLEHCPNVPYYSDFYGQPTQIAMIASLAGILMAGFLTFVIRNRRIVNPISWKKSACLGIVVLVASMLFNGLFSPYYKSSNIFYVLGFAASLLVVYLLFAGYVRFDGTTTEYFMTCVMTAGLLICAELLLAYLKGDVKFVNGSVVKESVILGWGIWTAVGGMIAFLMPATFYFAHSHRRGWIFYLLGFGEYFCILLSQSRGALLFGSVSLAICLAVLFFRGKNRRINRILTGVVAVVGIIGVVILSDRLLAVVQNYLDYGFYDNGRFEKWEYGWRHFREYPIFGAGFYNDFDYGGWEKSVFPYWYHNTLLQFLGSCGIIGFAGYVFHRATTVVLVLRRRNPCKLFLGICMLGLMLFSLLDVLFFNAYPTMIYALMLVFMERSEEDPQS